MKKFVRSACFVVSMFALVACSTGGNDGNTSASKKVSVTHELGTIEVPYDAKKIAVLDLAALDVLDALGLGDRVGGIPKSSSVSYLKSYVENADIIDMGSVKEVDMEALNSLQPDLIFIGGRLSSEYDNLSKIAPTILFSIDQEKGYMTSFKENVEMMGSIFGLEEKAKEITTSFESRIQKVNEQAKGKTAIISLVTSGSLSTLGNGTRGSLIGNEAGFENIAKDVNSTHGDTSSFELVLEKNPEYLFVLDRDTAINAEGAKIAKEVLENEIIQKTDAYKNNNIIYLTPDVWYLAEGGITATDIMIKDIESAFAK